jgi:hypothetical protein
MLLRRMAHSEHARILVQDVNTTVVDRSAFVLA